jgi:alkyl sulfatase BDS1-like metallo-beta-lactamase superfamily hydrolase
MAPAAALHRLTLAGQTLRGILGGKGPDELRALVSLPDCLREAPNNLENYGKISSYPPAIYYQSVGWCNNDAAHLAPVSPLEEARRIVPLVGGRDSLLAALVDEKVQE